MNLENTCAAQYFCENQDKVFSGYFGEFKVQKNSIYLKYNFCSIIDVHYMLSLQSIESLLVKW